MKRLLVIGGTAGNDKDAEMSTVYVQAGIAERHDEVLRSTDLLATLTAFGPAIELLDIYHHGSPGLMNFGRSSAGTCEALFASGPEEDRPLYAAVALDKLRDQLAPTAHVRLLGCSTATGPSGRMLIYKLASELGEHRVVWGTLGRLTPHHFSRGRFAYEPLLFSSLEAITGAALDWDQRTRLKPNYTVTT